MDEQDGGVDRDGGAGAWALTAFTMLPVAAAPTRPRGRAVGEGLPWCKVRRGGPRVSGA